MVVEAGNPLYTLSILNLCLIRYEDGGKKYPAIFGTSNN